MLPSRLTRRPLSPSFRVRWPTWSVAVASRLIGEDLNDDEHRKIIERYVNEAGSFNAN